MFFSVVIPTYNRLPILQKCLQAIAQQEPGGYDDYEVIVVDDGSTDDTIAWLESAGLERVSWYVQDHRGPAAARNLGVTKSQGDTIVFIDSDLVVVDDFLASHAAVLRQNVSDPSSELAKIFVYGRVINTSNFDDPRAEPFKPTDFSAAFFATG
ncbi:MAG: glycosyltransferase family A protein, partial [Cyanobacteria bacterium J06555_12]